LRFGKFFNFCRFVWLIFDSIDPFADVLMSYNEFFFPRRTILIPWTSK
jgi:hypothetical protein